ncbi:hypothetical protein KP509_27G031200 [Ceratopteris richardii]|nr:hypothetical protein KP509_27G031200 [Ceratopteris richardii]
MRKASWYSALCHLVFSMNIGAFQQWLSFEHMSGYLYNVLLQAVSSSKGTTEQSTLQASAIGTTKSHLNATAEKLAQELLWITEKLKDFSSLNRATENWGAQHSLAKLSLSADPHVQAYLLRVSGVFLKELAFSHAMTWNSNLKVSVLLSWLPLFCGAKAGFDYPCLKPSERADFLRNLEEIVMSLSMVDQELVLQCWLREFVSSASEWPNLQDCFEKWYSSVRISTCLPYQA